VLLDVAMAVAFETHLAKGLRDGGSDGGVGTGLVDSSDIGMDLVGTGGSVEIDMGVKVLGSSTKGFCATSKGILPLAGKRMGAMSVVVLVCTVTCTIVETVEARGVSPRIWLGVKC
jgi:hypothetical protein